MERLSEFNLVQSHYIQGCALPLFNDEKNHLKTLLEWTHTKEHDEENHRIGTFKYEAIDFIHFIDLVILNEIFINLLTDYKVTYPHSVKEDFIKYCLYTTYYESIDFIERHRTHKFRHSGDNLNGFDFYYFYNGFERRYYCIDESKDINHAVQYLRKIVDIIENLDYSTKEKKLKEKSTSKLLNNDQKELIQILIDMDSKHSHIWQFLRYEKSLISITERNFIKYLNEFHDAGLAEKKRFSQPKDLMIPNSFFVAYESWSKSHNNE